MKKITLDKFINKRIKENKKIFTIEEWKIAKKYPQIIKKVYLLGFINAKECYDKKK